MASSSLISVSARSRILGGFEGGHFLGVPPIESVDEEIPSSEVAIRDSIDAFDPITDEAVGPSEEIWTPLTKGSSSSSKPSLNGFVGVNTSSSRVLSLSFFSTSFPSSSSPSKNGLDGESFSDFSFDSDSGSGRMIFSCFLCSAPCLLVEEGEETGVEELEDGVVEAIVFLKEDGKALVVGGWLGVAVITVERFAGEGFVGTSSFSELAGFAEEES